MFMGRRVASMRWGIIHSDIKLEWVVAGITKIIKLDYEMVNVNRAKK